MIIINLEFWDFLSDNYQVLGSGRTERRSQTFNSLNEDSFSVNGRTLSRVQSLINSSATGLLEANIDGSNSVAAGAGFIVSTSSISAVATTPGVGD
jgi:hypothetical protein